MKKENAKPAVLLDPHFRRVAEIFAPDDWERLNNRAEIVWGRDQPMPEAEIAAARADVEAVITADWRHGALADFPRLRAILEVSGRLFDPETFDYATCFARGIRVLSCAPAFAPSVAEMALAMALSVARDLPAGDAAMRRGDEKYGWAGNGATFHLFDQPIGFIGFGSIARALRPLLAPFRCPIQVYDPYLGATFLRDQNVTPTPLETLLGTSKVIFVLAAPTAANRALLSRAELERIAPGAALILVSRAHLVDFDALTELLTAGRFRAAIDVLPQEPLPVEHPIRRAPGVVLSAHRAGGDASGFRRIGRIVVNDLEAILDGNAPQEMQAAQPEMIRHQGARAQNTSEQYGRKR